MINFKINSTSNPKPSLSLKQRLSALAYLPAFFKLVWQSNPRLTLTTLSLRIIKASFPFLILYVGKLIIDEVILLSRGGQSESPNYIWQLVGVEFVLGNPLGLAQLFLPLLLKLPVLTLNV